MDLMHGAYIFVCAIGVFYFYYRKKIDPMLVGFASTLIYFSPGMFGAIGFSYGEGEGAYRSAIASDAYIAMMMVIGFLIIGSYGIDRIKVGAVPQIFKTPGVTLSNGLLTLSIIGILISLETTGKGYLCQEKSDVLARLDVWYYVASYGASSAAVIAFSERKWIAFGVAVAIVGLDMLLGFRSAAAMAACGTLLIFSGNYFKSSQKIRYVGIILCLGVVFFVYKQLAWNVKYIFSVPCPAIGASNGESKKITAPIVLRMRQIKEVAKLAVSENTLVSAFSNSEPMVTQAVLNEVVLRDFKTTRHYLLDQVLSALPGAKTVFGIDALQIPSFNTLFQPELFPDVKFGMANNPWAQAYAAGGLVMVAIFALGYLAGLGILSFVYGNSQGSMRGAAAILSAWWAFYIHRNDLLVEAGIMKMILYILVCGWLVSACIDFVKSRLSRLSPGLKG